MLLALLLACAPHAPPAVTPAPSSASAAGPVGPARPGLPPGWRAGTVADVGVTDTDPAIGPADARFTIVSFADYFCPYCAAFWPKIVDFVKRNPDTRLVMKNWPIDNACNPRVETERHKFACLAASAAECAAREGRSTEMSALLYTYPEHVTPPEVPVFADRLGMDRAAFEACLADPAIAEAVRADVMAGIQAGVAGTPAIFVSGLDPAGFVDVAPDIAILDAALAEARAGRPLPP